MTSRRCFIVTVLVSTALSVHGKYALNPSSACSALRTTLHLENTTILSSTYASGPVNVSALGSCQTQALISSNLCRVQFAVDTSATSKVYAEAWLPDTWYGRFLGLGNSKLGGCIDYTNLDYGTSMHFATIGSNNGHDGLNGTVFLNQPEVINDFAYRAIHVEAVVGKQIVAAYYGRPHHKSYYLGCSTGGRQGTQSALKYAEDFDGIVAGAPATDWNQYLGWDTMMGRYIGAPYANNTPSFISPALWNVIAAEVLNQCDQLDGVKDGIITEPDSCEFRPEALLCTGGVTINCISRPQLDALNKIYRPLYGLDGEMVYPRYDPGTEANGNSQEILSGGNTSFAYVSIPWFLQGISRYSPPSQDWYRYAVFNNSNYNFENFGLQDIALAKSINPGGISTFSGNLSEFNNRGGKFITYHGRRDESIPSGGSKQLYNLISQAMNMPTLDSFYRLFLVPGMDHCIGGPGAYMFGQNGTASTAVNSSTHNVLLAIVDWVENDKSPEVVVGSAVDGTQRVHCRYPQKSVWNGTTYVCQSADLLFIPPLPIAM
ncbi:hypothetical protein C0991_000477 [Blastosporella zonata]|nr:hypothetical protein C0991_000477 [Blastosporella zonata]